YIYFFKRSARAPILFTFKKNNNLYFYKDYKSLNKIFVKNYYSLSLILEILDRISGNEYLFKYNINNVYY
ncbi:hypothetical protein BO83DRAFT_327483, partial [Aspergillus eucalypticola CBS 122712]